MNNQSKEYSNGPKMDVEYTVGVEFIVDVENTDERIHSNQCK